MILFTIFSALFFLLCFFIVLIVLIQRGKGNMGLGNVGGNNQMLFGSSGGQDIFQKITWIFLALFLGGSLTLSVIRARTVKAVRSSVSYQMPSSQEDLSFPAE
jgi:preprotein translocase subunit SecG